jgi:hypothetical protein
MRLVGWVVGMLLAISSSSVHAFADIECKVTANTMITQPGTFDRAVALVNKGKMDRARRYVRCLRDKGTRMFITGKPARGREMFVPVTTGSCFGETFRRHLSCPGDNKP